MTTYYVATNGSSTNNGTSRTTPWNASKALDNNVLVPGDEVIWLAGTYTASTFWIKHSGTAANYITFKSETRGGAKLKYTGANQGIKTYGDAYLKIENFDVSPQTSVGSGAGMAISLDCHHIEVRNCIVHDNAKPAIHMLNNEWMIIEYNECYNNNNGSANNCISQLCAYNVSGNTTDTTSWRTEIRGNLCYHNGLAAATTDSGGIMVDQNPINEPDGTDFPLYPYPRLVEDNICFENGGPGIIVLEADKITVRGNTAYHNGRKQTSDKPEGNAWAGNLVSRTDNIKWIGNVAIAHKAHLSNVPCIAIPVLKPRYLKSALVYVGVEWYDNLTFTGVAGEDGLFSTNGNNVNYPTAANGNKLGVDPKFVSVPATTDLNEHDFDVFDFHPGTGSPLIDGNNHAQGQSAKDFYKVTRGASPQDIGAIEHAVVVPPPTGTMRDDSAVSVKVVLRSATTDIATEVGLPSPFIQKQARNSSPAGYVADTGGSVQDAFGPVAKTIPAASGGHIIIEYSMEPE